MNRWAKWIADSRKFAELPIPLAVHGRLTRVAGLVLEVAGLRMPLGSVCHVRGEGMTVEAEVVGFANDRLYLMPIGDLMGLAPGALVVPDEAPVTPPTLGGPNHPWRRAEDRSRHLPMGDGLLGRVIDANGKALDRMGPFTQVRNAPLNRRPINAMDRDPVREVLDTGVRCINAMLTVGRGQRIGLFAGSGVGKSILLGMMARYTSADVIVVGLIGERGREVKEFIEDILGPVGRARSVVVAAPADTPPLVRMQGALYATAIAEHYRDQGKHVLLLLDSLTRYAMAQREIALAIGEPPATKGYPPSCFAKLPQLVERTGTGLNGRGSITSFYTVLTEGDDQQDPIADAARAILDGHIVLSRRLAESGHYPAIDIEQSISRVMQNICSQKQMDMMRRLKSLYARYQRNRDLIGVGAYVAGADPELDLAISLYPRIERLLQQQMHERASYGDSVSELDSLIAPTMQGGGR